MGNRLRMGFVGTVLGMVGCSSQTVAPPESSGEPLGLQMVRTEAQLKNYPFFTLLSFERDTDTVFTRTEGPAGKADSTREHTGVQSFQLEPGTRSMTIKLASLHSGREWPGPWTLVGAYFHATQPQRLTAAYEAEGRTLASYTVELPAGQWTPVLLDISALDGQTPSSAGVLRFGFGGLPAPVWCDDVIELNNTTMHVAGPNWSVLERGFQYTIECAGLPRLTLKTPEASGQGWVLEEVNEVRARFSSRGRQKSMLVYCNGRQIIDGVCQSSSSGSSASQQVSAATITVPAGMGRVNRNSSGDADNDGYAEMTGSYQLIAAGPRLELQIAPNPAPVSSPVLEIADLPPGQILATMEGRLIESVARLDSGHVLVALPGTLSRPTTVNVRVSQENAK